MDTRVGEIYEDFVAQVAEGRNLSTEQVNVDIWFWLKRALSLPTPALQPTLDAANPLLF